MNVIPHSRPCLGEEEAAAAAEVVRSGWLKGGPRREALERVIAADQGFAHALAVTSCTQAVHLALRARFPEGGARVVLPAYLCRSVWDAVKLAGCEPVLVDSCEADLGPALDTTMILEPDAVIVPHLAGIRAPVEGFLGRGLFVIEDCAQRIQPGDRPARPDPNHVRVFSFEATKVITCGEGGMLALNDAELARVARGLRDGDSEGAATQAWLPFTDLQAAIALVQWRRLPGLALARRRNMDRLRAVVPENLLHPAMRKDNAAPFRFLMYGMFAADLMSAGEIAGVAVRKPVGHGSLHTLYAPQNWRFFPGAAVLSHALVSIPCQPSLSADEMDRVVAFAAEQAAAANVAAQSQAKERT